MTALRTYLLGVIAAAMAISLLSSLMPRGKYRAVGSLVSGLVLLAVLLQPLFHGTLGDLELQKLETEAAVQDYAEAHNAQLAAVISEKTAAYIQDKASALGLVCRAEVDCTWRDGVPFPTRVRLDIPYHHKLSRQITDDLAIDAQHQFWEESP